MVLTSLRAQNSPHMVHMSCSEVGLRSLHFLGFSWSNASSNCLCQSKFFLATAISTSRSHAPFTPLAISRCFCSYFRCNHSLLNILYIGYGQMLCRGNVAQEVCSRCCCNCTSNCRGYMIVTRSKIRYKGA